MTHEHLGSAGYTITVGCLLMIAWMFLPEWAKETVGMIFAIIVSLTGILTAVHEYKTGK